MKSAQTMKWDKINSILRWIEAWGYTDFLTVQQHQKISKKSAYSTIKMMMEMGLVQTYRVAICPATIIGITATGVKHLEHTRGGQKSTFSPPASRSMMPRTPAHDLIVQQAVLNVVSEAKKKGCEITGSWTQKGNGKKTLRADFVDGIAVIPDAILTIDDGNGNEWGIAVEVQESRESAETAERRMSAYEILREEGKVGEVIWFSTSPEIVDQLERIIASPVRQFSLTEKKIHSRDGRLLKNMKIWEPMPSVPRMQCTVHEIRDYSDLRAKYYADGGKRGSAILI